MCIAPCRCEITGAWQNVEVHEKWQFDDSSQVVRLSGFEAVSLEVHQVGQMLMLPAGSQQAQQAQQLLVMFNSWGEQDVQTYLGHMRQVQQQRSQPTWKLDLGLLRQLSIEVPAAIAPIRLAAK
jgi:hypothetical protein